MDEGLTFVTPPLVHYLSVAWSLVLQLDLLDGWRIDQRTQGGSKSINACLVGVGCSNDGLVGCITRSQWAGCYRDELLSTVRAPDDDLEASERPDDTLVAASFGSHRTRHRDFIRRFLCGQDLSQQSFAE